MIPNGDMEDLAIEMERFRLAGVKPGPIFDVVARAFRDLGNWFRGII